jgi:hypothetical protein
MAPLLNLNFPLNSSIPPIEPDFPDSMHSIAIIVAIFVVLIVAHGLDELVMFALLSPASISLVLPRKMSHQYCE